MAHNGRIRSISAKILLPPRNGLEKLTSLLDIDWTFRGANSHVGGLKWNCETKYLTSAQTEFEPRAFKGHP